MANEEIREALLTLDRAITTQVNRDIGLRLNALESTMTFILRDIVRMNPILLYLLVLKREWVPKSSWMKFIR